METSYPTEFGSRQITKEGFNFSPVYYKDNGINYLYFPANRDGYSSLYRIKLSPEFIAIDSPELILRGEQTEEFEAFHLFQSAIDISKDGIIVFNTKMGGNDAIHFYSVKEDRIVMVETCIDDMNPEVFGFLMDRLFEEGALDVYWIPIFMKKNRPATMVNVLCPEKLCERIMNCILSETTSTGVRYYSAKRRMLLREPIVVNTSFGEIAAKRLIELDGSARIVPEYEICKKIAIEKKLPLRLVYDTILKSL